MAHNLTKAEIERRLRNRYDEQLAKFPRTAEIGWELYRRRNLPTCLLNQRHWFASGDDREVLSDYR